MTFVNLIIVRKKETSPVTAQKMSKRLSQLPAKPRKIREKGAARINLEGNFFQRKIWL